MNNFYWITEGEGWVLKGVIVMAAGGFLEAQDMKLTIWQTGLTGMTVKLPDDSALQQILINDYMQSRSESQGSNDKDYYEDFRDHK